MSSASGGFTPGRRSAALALLLLVPAPSVGLWIVMQSPSGSGGTASTVSRQ